MRQLFAATTVLLVILATPASARPVRIEQLIGEWRITRNTVEDAPVTAYADNDPDLIGGALIVRRNKMRFVNPKIHRAKGDLRPLAFDESLGRCLSAEFFDVSSVRFKVRCAASERFGPEMGRRNFTLLSPTKLRIEWYDGVTLYLTKRK